MLQAVHPSDWDSVSHSLCAKMGFPAPTQDPVIFTDTGRYLGPLSVFEDLVLRKYGVQCDLDDHRLREIAQENLETAEKVQKETAEKEEAAV